MKSLQHDQSIRGYDINLDVAASEFQLGPDDPVSRGTTRLPDDIKRTASGFWTGGLSHVTLPYMPYVSNCAGYDSHVPLWKLFQNSEQCIFRSPNETTTTSQFDLISSEKLTDYCDVRLHCRYEEDITTGDASRAYWFEGNFPEFLFFLSREPMKSYEFGGWLKAMGTAINEKKQSEEVNRLIKFENEKLDRYRLYHAVPVSPMKAKVNINEEVIRTGTVVVAEPVENEGPRSYPKLVHMLVEFWQELEDRKQIAKATIYFSDYRSSAAYTSARTNLERQRHLEYTFRTTFRHLDYMGLLDNFSLPMPLYVLISFVVGILITMMFFSIWWALLKSKRFNSVIPHPQMEILSGITLIGGPAILGFGYAFLPTFLIVFIVQMILHKDYLGPLLTDSLDGNVYYFGERSEMVIKTTQQGRMGLSYTLLGVIIVIKAANATNPLEPKEKNSVTKKNLWRRSQVLLHTIGFIFFQTLMIMISRTSFYKADVSLYSLIMKVSGAGLLTYLDQAIPDRLSTAPYRMCQETIIKTMSMGTVAFTQFMINYIMLVVFASGTQLLSPLAQAIMPKLEEHFKKYAAIIKKLQSLWAVEEERDDAEDKKKAEPNDLKKLTKIIQHQYLNSTATVSQMFTIPVALLVIMFSDFLKVESMYGQKDLLITIFFGVVIFVFQVIVDAFVENILEFAFAMKIHHYLKDMTNKFYGRKKRWILDENFRDVDPEWGDENEPKAHQFRAEQSSFLKIHQMCFSEQFYFLVSIVTLGQIITVYALFMLYSSLDELPRYYPFDDFPMGLILILGMLIVCTFVQILIFKSGQYLGIWGLKGIRRTQSLQKTFATRSVESDEDVENANKKFGAQKVSAQDGKDNIGKYLPSFQDELRPGPQDGLVPETFNREIERLYFQQVDSPRILLDKVEALVSKTVRLNNNGVKQEKLLWSQNLFEISNKMPATGINKSISTKPGSPPQHLMKALRRPRKRFLRWPYELQHKHF